MALTDCLEAISKSYLQATLLDMASSGNPFGSPAVNEDFDMNDFVNFDQGFHNSPSPIHTKLEPRHSIDPRHVNLHQMPHPRQQYNGPSHNYDQFRQQTGLPTGAVSHVQAVNQYSNSVPPAHFVPANFSYTTGLKFEPPASSESPTYLATHDGNIDEFAEFAIDPSAIAPDTQPVDAFRAWPGMHSEQAKQQAQAKDQAKQRRQEEAMQSQQPLPSDFQATFGGRSRSQTESEPQVNEQISRLLNQMRHNSNASADDDEDGKAGFGGMSSAAHARKTDEDMDEDERLLASEEGKKLSSKERRQLRNKVSARAFRSRRKEYITQLEGEVNGKTNECNDLKRTNHHLLEQNRQLTQLCKTMLNHPAFGTFMEDMSNDPSLLNAFAPQQNSAHSQGTDRPNEHEQAHLSQGVQQQHQPVTHVGMTMVPETNLDFSTLNLGANRWNNNNFQQPQIFAVYEVPSGPSFEELHSSVLSGKGTKFDDTAIDAKLDRPICKNVPKASTQSPPAALSADEAEDVSDIQDDPMFALYIDTPSVRDEIPSHHPTLESALSRLEQSLSGKPSLFSVSVQKTADDGEQLHAVDCLFAQALPLLQRLEEATYHLPS